MPIISQSWSLLQSLIAFVGMNVARVQTEQIIRRLPAAKLFEKKGGNQREEPHGVPCFKDFPETVDHTYISLRKGLQGLDSDLTAISFRVVPVTCATQRY